MSLINIKNLTFSYDTSHDVIFDNVSFQLDTDWRLGFTGRNGRGKTTFLKLLMREYEYSGVISASVNFEYFPFSVSDADLTPPEIAGRLDPDFQLWRLQKELSLLDMDEGALYRPYNTLSPGEQGKVMLAILFIKENSFLLIDEPTNHLDAAARKKVCGYLSGKKGFILVSHDQKFLDGCTDHTLSINKADIQVTKGSFSVWMENKERRDSFELSENEKLEGQIKRLTDAAKSKSAWADNAERAKYNVPRTEFKDTGFLGHKAAKQMKSAKILERRSTEAANEKTKLLKNVETNEELKLRPLEFRTQKLVEGSGLFAGYGGESVLCDISFTVCRGDRISVTGKNGSGKSTLLKLITGEVKPTSGILNVQSGLIISYVPQSAAGLSGGLKQYALENKLDESLFKTILIKLDFDRVQFDKDISEYSEGQKKKVLIAKSLCDQAHLYIWDEPLNFIDIFSRLQIEELILKYRPTMVFIEHDMAFAEKIATKSIEL